jgi:hypothetical protein
MTVGERFLTGKIVPKQETSIYYRSMVTKAYEFSSFLTSIGVANWLVTGTALGAIRDKKVLKRDFDFDLGIWHKDVKKIHDLPDNVKAKFNIFSWHLSKDHDWYEGTKLAVENGNLPIDVGEYVAQGDLAYPVSDPRLICKKKFFENLKKIKFYGYNFYVPGDSIEYLQAIYGPRWLNPITRKEYVGKFHLGDFWYSYCNL